MSLKDIEREFPHLSPSDYSKKSDEDDGYNCVAWAIEDGRTDNWWSPVKLYGYYWPPNVPRGIAISIFRKLFEIVCGYQRCDNGDLEEGYQKIALYENDQNHFIHVARQKSDGVWTSKLGVLDDIEHPSPHVLESDYGSLAHFMRRPRKS